MITETRTCHECQSPNIVRNGKNRVGNQRYLCKNCGVTRVLDSRLPTRELDLEALERSYRERNSLRATGRIFGVSHVTVFQHLKKRRARQ
jgi:transposase-like protein